MKSGKNPMSGYKKIVAGITGHRTLCNKKEISRILLKELNAFSEQRHKLTSIVSPLAEGADRLAADLLITEFGTSLIVPLPFEMEHYKRDFSVAGVREFEKYLSGADEVYEVASLTSERRDVCYLKAGKEVVRRSNFLIAIWDGKKANGTGGTGDIVAFAHEKGSPILHIHPQLLEVRYINFSKEKNDGF